MRFGRLAALPASARPKQTHLNWMSYVDLNLRLPELLLMRVDKMTMGVGLEGRVPFLDHRFVGAGAVDSERAQDEERHAEVRAEAGGRRTHSRRI